MKKRLGHLLLCAGVLLLAALTAFTVSASAEKRVLNVKLASGEVVVVTVDVPPNTPLSEIALPEDLGDVVAVEEVPTSTTPTPTTTVPAPAPTPSLPSTPQLPATEVPVPTPVPVPDTDGQSKPTVDGSARQESGGGDRRKVKTTDSEDSEPKVEGEENDGKDRDRRPSLRNPDGSPTDGNPGLVDVLPGAGFRVGVPNFVIEKFRVPVFLLPIYQAAGIEYGVRWEVLAAINEIETDYGRNLNVSSAGALGWMQFMPSSWEAYGVDANKDGKKDPYNPVDAIFAAANYLKAAGFAEDERTAIFAYNHADWYVDSVLLRARLIAGVPADLVGSLTGLTEGRFPVAARARYADDLREQEALRRVREGENAANVIEGDEGRRSIEIFAQKGSPVVAANDGQIKRIGFSQRLGNYVVLQDVYGNSYTYAGLDSVAKFHPVPKEQATLPVEDDGQGRSHEEEIDEPAEAASAGRQPATDEGGSDETSEPVGVAASIPIKQRLFAHPGMPAAKESGGLEQILDAESEDGRYETYANYFSRPFGADTKDVRLRALKKGSKVIGGTILGRVGVPEADKAAHLDFSIRPAGRGAPLIDPKPILDGWKLLEATAIYRATGRNVLYSQDQDGGGLSIGQILLMSKPQLERRVLADKHIEIYDGGRSDIQTGQIDRRVLATLAYLSESGLRPTITSMKTGHSYLTASGNISHHSTGNAVDIAQINGIPIYGHQEPGGITEQTIKRLMGLQGTMRPNQIISLLDHGANTIAMADHADHIHIGFTPLYNHTQLGTQAMTILKPGQWSDLITRLGQIQNPQVPTTPSPYATPANKNSRNK